MTFAIRVKDGTGAGRRKVRKHPDWYCGCVRKVGERPGRVSVAVSHPGDRYSCPDCGARRPS